MKYSQLHFPFSITEDKDFYLLTDCISAVIQNTGEDTCWVNNNYPLMSGREIEITSDAEGGIKTKLNFKFAGVSVNKRVNIIKEKIL
ncbi:MAG: hypothetical protein K9H62_12450 [Bacteroidales bacterium]|nr:hypothetical protein [Bacteroidales bacterium]